LSNQKKIGSFAHIADISLASLISTVAHVPAIYVADDDNDDQADLEEEFQIKKKGGPCDRQTIKRVLAMKKTC
jgi:hypothetical protein